MYCRFINPLFVDCIYELAMLVVCNYFNPMAESAENLTLRIHGDNTLKRTYIGTTIKLAIGQLSFMADLSQSHLI